MALHSRMRRVEEQVARTLADLLLREVKDDRLRAANVTHAKVSKDLSHAIVSVSCLDSADGAPEAMMEALDRARGWLRHELGQRVRLRRTPELKFILDRSADDLENIQRLLREAGTGEGENP